ncbi:MAG: DUF4149 domain-containing protein [Polyangiaceae bacterium]|nr:DUF4149 domain-containing protein [Polyangiaceae bacterium]
MIPNETRFTADDLAPSPEERRAARKALADRIAAAAASLSAGLAAGGLFALGACAAPFVFSLTPSPYSGHAMGSAFARFDQFAIGASILILAAEIVRTWAAGRRARSVFARIRRIAAIVMAASASYIGLALTPRIIELHRSGAVRGLGAEGLALDAVHARASLVGKVEIAAAVALVFLHVLTIAPRRPEEDDDDEAVAPLPPGPSD